MKMYIVIKEGTPDKLVPVIAAHASLACYKKFEAKDGMKVWMAGVFRKVVCLANEVEFGKLKEEPDFVALTESAIGDGEVCLAFCPREEYPKKFRFLRMWTPQGD